MNFIAFILGLLIGLVIIYLAQRRDGKIKLTTHNERSCFNCKQQKDCTIKFDNHGELCQMHNYGDE